MCVCVRIVRTDGNEARKGRGKRQGGGGEGKIGRDIYPLLIRPWCLFGGGAYECNNGEYEKRGKVTERERVREHERS